MYELSYALTHHRWMGSREGAPSSQTRKSISQKGRRAWEVTFDQNNRKIHKYWERPKKCDEEVWLGQLWRAGYGWIYKMPTIIFEWHCRFRGEHWELYDSISEYLFCTKLKYHFNRSIGSVIQICIDLNFKPDQIHISFHNPGFRDIIYMKYKD